MTKKLIYLLGFVFLFYSYQAFSLEKEKVQDNTGQLKERFLLEGCTYPIEIDKKASRFLRKNNISNDTAIEALKSLCDTIDHELEIAVLGFSRFSVPNTMTIHLTHTPKKKRVIFKDIKKDPCIMNPTDIGRYDITISLKEIKDDPIKSFVPEIRDFAPEFSSFFTKAKIKTFYIHNIQEYIYHNLMLKKGCFIFPDQEVLGFIFSFDNSLDILNSSLKLFDTLNNLCTDLQSLCRKHELDGNGSFKCNSLSMKTYLRLDNNKEGKDIVGVSHKHEPVGDSVFCLMELYYELFDIQEGELIARDYSPILETVDMIFSSRKIGQISGKKVLPLALN
ncbi:MAG: hypothetical protein ABIA04_13460 [Pseudomonadota bacterium]